jgi:hypothetical protein
MKLLRFLLPVFCFHLCGPTAALRAEGQPAPTESELVSAAEALVDALAREDFATAIARFSPTMRRSLPEARLRTLWETMRQQAGNFQSRLGSRVQAQGTSHVVFVGTEFREFTLEAKVVFNAAGEVTALQFMAPPKVAVRPMDQGRGAWV